MSRGHLVLPGQHKMSSTTWRRATERALYGPGGFFLSEEGPAGHFRTSAHCAPFADALVTLLAEVDRALGRPERLDLVDVGAGRGELLLAMLAAAPPTLRDRLMPTAVERAARPTGLDPRIRWTAVPPPGVTGLVLATEWLDGVPVDVAEVDGAGVARIVLVEHATGREHPGPPVAGADAAWLAEWWPLGPPAPAPGARGARGAAGSRAEIGWPRDVAWAGLVRTVRRGALLAVDYAHTRADRPSAGSLAAYARGRPVPPVPDGSCDVTSHVALDAVAAAGVAAGAATWALSTQRQALTALGLHTAPGFRTAPGPSTARAVTFAELARRSRVAELTEHDGLGGHSWLVQTVRTDLVSVVPRCQDHPRPATMPAGGGAS